MNIIEAIKKEYEGKRGQEIYDLQVYINNPVGVGDNPTIIDTIDKELAALDSANGKLNVLIKYIEKAKPEEPKKEKK